MSLLAWFYLIVLVVLVIGAIRCVKRVLSMPDDFAIIASRYANPKEGTMPRNKRAVEAGDGPEDSRSASIVAKVEEGHEPTAEPPQATAMPSIPEQQAGHLKETVPALFMYASVVPVFGQIDERAYKIFRDRLLADCGSPKDPIETMVIEQLALAHLNFGLLQCRAANARQVEAVGVYSGAAARLMAEFRRSALGLQAYRSASRQLASAGAEPAAFLPGDPADLEDLPEKIIASTEKEPTRSDEDDEERSVLPMPRAATL
jgi:hypothetical protein